MNRLPVSGTLAPDPCLSEPDRLGSRRFVYGTLWLVFLVFPLSDALGSRQSIGARAAIAAAVAAFVSVYLAQLRRARRLPGRESIGDRNALLMVGAQLAIAVALTLADRPAWSSLFIFTVAGAVVSLHGRVRGLAFALCAVLTPLTGAVAHGRVGDVIAYSTTTIGIGMLMLALADLRARNQELSAARAELARLAVAEERERFGRDLHDLLGQSLSVIALKAELAGRLLPGSPDRAATEIAELESVARQALGEVREAVSGYRQPTLERELGGARMALSAAGIEAEVHRDDVSLEPAAEAVLAWAVREGATNVIRHSRAERCTIRIAANLTEARAEVIDDGARGSGPNGNRGANGHVNGGRTGGTGLLGLAERARGLGGTLQAGSIPEGGFRLSVSIPVQR